ncbi:unnamed protein product [Euphydryas editha]|uniref:GH16 domain-containing protein n=1 Tax=Euphydryas editha TaxID=104508 RepID=A0AAU9TVM1_EUPED|nr:unnamed protein product [Euphydryas editha]
MTSKVIVYLFVLVSCACSSDWYENVRVRTIQALKPRGIRVFLPELEDPSAPGAHCTKTATKVKGGYACAKEVIFEDNFDTFRDDLWQIEQYIPIDHPNWSDDFHEYSLTWKPDEIALSVNGVSYATYLPGPAGLLAWLPRTCREDRRLLAGGFMAPFDHHFQIALGVAVRGVMEFPDGLISGGKPKPWRNRGRRASLSFWQDKDYWYPTWTQPGLVIDYVKVVAL